jgi:hypothetical protein
MKNLKFLLLVLVFSSLQAQSPYVIHQQLQLNTVPFGTSLDSVLVINNLGKVFKVPRSSFGGGGDFVTLDTEQTITAYKSIDVSESNAFNVDSSGGYTGIGVTSSGSSSSSAIGLKINSNSYSNGLIVNGNDDDLAGYDLVVLNAAGSQLGLYVHSEQNAATTFTNNTSTNPTAYFQNVGEGGGIRVNSYGGAGGYFNSTYGNGLEVVSDNYTAGTFTSYNGEGIRSESFGTAGYFNSTDSNSISVETNNGFDAVAIYNGGDGAGVSVTSYDGIAGYFNSTNSNGVRAVSDSNLAGEFISNSGSGVDINSFSLGLNITTADDTGIAVNSYGTGISIQSDSVGAFVNSDGNAGIFNSSSSDGIHAEGLNKGAVIWSTNDTVLTANSLGSNDGINVNTIGGDIIEGNAGVFKVTSSGDITSGVLAGSGTRSVSADSTGKLVIGGGAAYKVYTALLSQAGASAPTATVLENTTGYTFTYAYASPGIYSITSSTTLPLNKTVIFSGSGLTGGGVAKIINASYASGTVTVITANNIGVNSNDILSQTSIEIRVYP